MLINAETLGEVVYKAWITHTGGYGNIQYSELLPKEQSLYIAIGETVAKAILANPEAQTPPLIDLDNLESLIANIHYCETSLTELLKVKDVLYEHYYRKLQLLPITEDMLYVLLTTKFSQFDKEMLRQTASTYIDMSLMHLNECYADLEKQLNINPEDPKCIVLSILLKFVIDLAVTFIQ